MGTLIVKDLDQAEKAFLERREDEITCVKDDRKAVVVSYPEAIAFFMDLSADTIVQCECGDYHHVSLSHMDDSGANSCPGCMMEFLKAQVKEFKALAKEIADPELSNEDISNMIKQKYAKIIGVSVDDLVEGGFFDYDDEEE